jgi:hypothetical protein
LTLGRLPCVPSLTLLTCGAPEVPPPAVFRGDSHQPLNFSLSQVLASAEVSIEAPSCRAPELPRTNRDKLLGQHLKQKCNKYAKLLIAPA